MVAVDSAGCNRPSHIRLSFDVDLRACPHRVPGTRSHRLEEPSWGEEEESSEHDYYNSIPGKEPPLGGVVDSRLRPSTSLIGHIHTQPQSKAANQVSSSRRSMCLGWQDLTTVSTTGLP